MQKCSVCGSDIQRYVVKSESKNKGRSYYKCSSNNRNCYQATFSWVDNPIIASPIKCDTCGSPMKAFIPDKDKNPEHKYYRCFTVGKCREISFKWINDFIVSYIPPMPTPTSNNIT